MTTIREVLSDLVAQTGRTFRLSVLAPKNDPLRLDTPANHRIGQWLGNNIAAIRQANVIRGRAT